MNINNESFILNQSIVTRKEAKQKGLKQYFTGKPCPRGHVWIRSTKQAICLLCAADKSQLQSDKHAASKRQDKITCGHDVKKLDK